MVRTHDQEKRTAILKAARTIFLRDGYAAAKISDIASESGVAPGTLYLYFASKEALASALGEDLLNRVGNQFAKVIKKLDTPEGVDALLDWALRIGMKERDILALVKQSKPDAKAPPQARELFALKLSENLADFMSRGSVRKYDDATGLANVVLAVMHRLIMSCAMYEDSNPELVKTSAVKLLQHALFDDAALKRWRASSQKQSL
jgi:AcrR family transcriptional regulator